MKYFTKYFLFLFISASVSLESKEIHKKLIVLSIDGFPGYYANSQSDFYKFTPNLNLLREKSNFSNSVTSVYPTMTYPAHTSMVTGVDPESHRIRFNSPVDPFGKNSNGWMWYFEDINVRSIFDFLRANKKKSASIYWPVTAGADIDYNIPQYWRAKNKEDEKLLRLLSTKGLYDELKKEEIFVSEATSDKEKIKAGIYLWKNKKPDALFIYTTDLDTAHHNFGIYSPQAKEKLITIDLLIKELVEETSLYSKKNLSLIIVSDHGFKEIKNMCYPNTELKAKGFFNPEKETWKFYFKTMGGFSVLLQNEDNPGFSLSISELSTLKQSIESKCLGTNFIFEGGNFDKLRRKFHSNAKAFLFSKGDTGFGEKIEATTFKSLEKPFSNHGFLPGDSSMKTMLLSYPKKVNVELKSIKNVFTLGCDWLKIKCEKGERKN